MENKKSMFVSIEKYIIDLQIGRIYVDGYGFNNCSYLI